MDKFTSADSQKLDDQLAEFTDRVLSDMDETEMELDDLTNQVELAELKKTILRMKAAVRTAYPSDMAKARARTRLLMEWKNTSQSKPKLFNFPWSLPRISLVGGLVVLILVGFATFFLPPTSNPLTATAEGSPVWAPIFIVVGIVIISIFLWLDRHN
jgi:sterol desaturase/sphingolipid hydroxylase (fatty acid hydroxylase superfamily)